MVCLHLEVWSKDGWQYGHRESVQSRLYTMRKECLLDNLQTFVYPEIDNVTSSLALVLGGENSTLSLSRYVFSDGSDCSRCLATR